MSTLFGKLKDKASKAEAPVDRVGGGFKAQDTDIYIGTLKVAYAGQSDKGANFVQVIIEDLVNATTGASAGTHREQLYITSGNVKGNSPTYEKNGKEFFLPGYTVANDIFVMTAETELPDTVFEEKVVNIYDFEQSKELPKSVMVPVDAVGQKVAVALKKSQEYKRVKGNDGYVDSDEIKEVVNIDKVFHPDLKLTVLEVTEALAADRDLASEEPVFWNAWLEANQGKVDTHKLKKSGNAGTAGAPPAAANPTAGAAKKSLFGKK